MYAPSANNVQPWHFVVVTDREKLDKTPDIQPYTQMSRLAPLAILVCGDKEASPRFFDQDCSAVTQNILLEAHYLGLGAVWCGVHPTQNVVEGFRQLLDIPPHLIPFAYIPMGYPDTSAKLPVPHGRCFQQERIHYNKW